MDIASPATERNHLLRPAPGAVEAAAPTMRPVFTQHGFSWQDAIAKAESPVRQVEIERMEQRRKREAKLELAVLQALFSSGEREPCAERRTCAEARIHPFIAAKPPTLLTLVPYSPE